ncbi:GDSL lipase-like [Euphorbia lathyris]|uniref:GDSL lipase-like n=1 Tax=Euphorbia lathyris TaxID=212925 RepID=UPI0033139FEE
MLLHKNIFGAIFCLAIAYPIARCYAQQNAHKLLLVFGDSLFDPGNNQYLNGTIHAPATTYPYGMSFNNHSTGRLSDGLILPDFIAQNAGMNLLPPFLKPGANFSDGANFASAGAGVLETHSGVMNLKVQISNFKKVLSSLVKKVGETEAKKTVMRSVFLLSLGGNDYFSFSTDYPNATTAERTKYVNMVIANLTNGIKELYENGLRKLAIQNVGPLGCYPTVKAMFPQVNGTCVRTFLVNANLHNRALSQAMNKLETQLPGFKYSIFDYFHALAARIQNPAKYGFKDGEDACCGSGLYNGRGCGEKGCNVCSNPNEYVLFDGAHHTQRTNQQLAQLLWSGVPRMTGPYNMKQLFQFA